MKSLIHIICILLITLQAFAQMPLVKMWDKRFGGTGMDILRSFEPTTDGGYILGGYSFSGNNGDKSQPNWDSTLSTVDYWVVKINSVGAKQWDYRYGGRWDDQLSSLQQTTDEGYILGGYSNSKISGDKTQPSWGNTDYWVVKIDSAGIKQWDYRYGGTGEDRLFSLQQTTDAGYILGGYSNSEISGDKTQSSHGFNDYWMVKIDSVGIKQWDKRFGGYDDDYLMTLKQTADGGYLLGGYSMSDSSGDKTQHIWDSHSPDYWIVKTDSVGIKQWDKRFGGYDDDRLYSLQQTVVDGGYILGGWSNSALGGDKSQNNLGRFDFWIVKIDSLGNKQWDKRYGGTDEEDEFGNISQTPDNGYLLAGTSYSLMSGDKSESNLGLEQSWIIKTDALGNKQWDKTLFTTGHDEICYALQTKDRCYAMANYTQADTGGYKTQPNRDTIPNTFTVDYWIIKFCDTTFVACASLNVTTNSVTAHVTCLGASDGAAKAVASGGTPPYSFLWSEGQNDNSPTDFPAGTHSVTVTDYNDCTATTSITIAEGELPCTGIQENLLSNISLDPNPTSGTITLKANIQEQATLKLFDALGRQVWQHSPAGNELAQGVVIDLAQMNGGIYFLSIRTTSGSRVMKVVRY